MLVSSDLEEAVCIDDRVLLTRRPARIAQIVPFPAPRRPIPIR